MTHTATASQNKTHHTNTYYLINILRVLHHYSPIVDRLIFMSSIAILHHISFSFFIYTIYEYIIHRPPSLAIAESLLLHVLVPTIYITIIRYITSIIHYYLLPP